ncbi:MAG: cellulose synthase/poly-beta-1,6-N-acetylglucosamine synthase-like glycosyltransferase [Flavobacteriales bacterium]|jgi:cellulose synthase/poly-beta-1,6-N-acetylglucosamine synthase-like glycosyltransferase
MFIISYTFYIALAILFVPTLMFCIECLLGLYYHDRKNTLQTFTRKTSDIRSAIIVPAHNEEDVINDTLTLLSEQLTDKDTVYVVADNCSDNTIELCKAYDVNVLERNDDKNRGKGFALDFGLQHIQNSTQEVIIILDADCLLGEDALAHLKEACIHYNLPIQAKYLIQHRELTSFTKKISEFAVLVKNSIRLNGMRILNLGVPLCGTGMAFPWDQIKHSQLASSEIVEDMKLGVDLAIAGAPPLYFPQATVTSYFPTSEESLKSQRERWEHGHLGIIQSMWRPLLGQSIIQKRLALLGVLIDITIPPLAVLILMQGFAFVVSLILALVFSSLSYAILPTMFLGVITCVVLIVWHAEGRHILTGKDLILLPSYIFSKLNIYKKFIKGRQKSWVKTDRN